MTTVKPKLCARCETAPRAGTLSYCLSCWKEYYKEHREVFVEARKKNYRANKNAYKLRARKCRLKNKYGLTLEEFAAMEASQQYVCAICLTPGKLTRGDIRLAVDHCHATGKIRELLCFNCNALLGQSQDNIEILKKAIAYLQKHGH